MTADPRLARFLADLQDYAGTRRLPALEHHFVDDVGIDSVEFLEFVAIVTEDRWEQLGEDVDWLEIQTVGDLWTLLSEADLLRS